MKFCYNTNFTLPKQSQRSRSILQDGSRSLGLFWKEKILSYNRRNMVDIDHHINKQNCVTTMINIVQTCWIQSRLNDYSLHSRWVKLLQSFNIKLQVIFFFFFSFCVFIQECTVAPMIYLIIFGMQNASKWAVWAHKNSRSHAAISVCVCPCLSLNCLINSAHYHQIEQSLKTEWKFT